MNVLFSGAIVLFLVAAASAQTGRKFVYWSGDKACGFKSRSVVPEDAIGCGAIQTERGTVNTITYNGVSLAVAIVEDHNHLILGAHITNSTKEPVLFDSDLWGAAHFKTRADFRSGEKPMLAETSIPSRDLIRGMSAGTKLESSLGEFMGDMQLTTEIKEVRRADGSRQRVRAIVQDKSAKDIVRSENIARSDSMTQEQRRIRENALTTKTVSAGAFTRGLVYFRRVKKAEHVVFSITVEDATFVFQLLRKAG